MKKKIIVYTRSKKKNTNIHEPQRTFINEDGDEEVAQGSPIADRDVIIEPEMIIGGDEAVGDVAAMTTSEKPLPQEITPSTAVHKYARKSKKSQFCRSPYTQFSETPALITLGYTGPYNGSLNQCNVFPLRRYGHMLLKQ